MRALITIYGDPDPVSVTKVDETGALNIEVKSQTAASMGVAQIEYVQRPEDLIGLTDSEDGKMLT